MDKQAKTNTDYSHMDIPNDQEDAAENTKGYPPKQSWGEYEEKWGGNQQAKKPRPLFDIGIHISGDIKE